VNLPKAGDTPPDEDTEEPEEKKQAQPKDNTQQNKK
jgi:hypothetical protein